MSADVLGIFQGQIFATTDGTEITVLDLDPEAERVLIETVDFGQGVMELGVLLRAIRSGELTTVKRTADDDGRKD